MYLSALKTSQPWHDQPCNCCDTPTLVELSCHQHRADLSAVEHFLAVLALTQPTAKGNEICWQNGKSPLNVLTPVSRCPRSITALDQALLRWDCEPHRKVLTPTLFPVS